MIQDRREAADTGLGCPAPKAVLTAALADLPGPERTRYAPILARHLSRWAVDLRSARLSSDHGPVLAIWLAEGPAHEIDQAMAVEPTLGLLLHRLASGLVMTVLAELRPQAAARGCAPWPDFCPCLTEALSARGLIDEQGRLAHRYAVLTLDTPEAGCADCGLRHGCQGPRHGDRP